MNTLAATADIGKVSLPPWRRSRAVGLAFLAALFAVGLAGCPDDAPSPNDAGTHDVAIDTSDANTLDASGDEEIVEPPTLLDGDACTADTDCVSGRCLTEAEGFPGGYCTFVDCVERADCAGVTRGCLRGQFNGNLCVELCFDDDSCRDGYECRSIGSDSGSGGYCYPAFASDNLDYRCDSELIAEDDVLSSYFADMDRHRLSFDISDDATSFAVVVYNRTNDVLADTLLTPSGESHSLLGEYGFFMRTGLILENISPMFLPAGPDWLPWIEPGTYTMDVGTTGDEVCYFVLENHGLGTRINLNFYFVGVRGLNAQSADRDPDFQQMLESFSSTMALAEIEVDGLRYFDVTGDVEDAFSRIFTEAQVYELMRLSRAPGQTREDLLSVNVFFVRDFSGDMFSVLGVAPGIPGVMGIHGQEGTGLIFSAANLGSENGNRMVGQVLAHELGHYLGLAHTTELEYGTDWLDDTPECEDISFATLQSCPDFHNLMFPVASYRDQVDLSNDQVLVLRSNPQARP